MHDAIVVGGGPAGLQAALTLGRTHRDVLLLDSGRYRNDPTDAMHNVIGHDGEAPAEFRAAAREDLARYATVTVRDNEALEVEALDGGSPGGGFHDVRAGFAIRTTAGTVTGRRLLLATGMRDELPTTPGLQALFGTIAAHCPYCHGHEFAGMPVGVLGADQRTGHLVGLMAPIASRIVVFADGGEPAPEVRAALEDRGAPVVREPVARVEPAVLDGGRAGARVVLEGAPDVEVGGLMVPTTVHQSTPFAAQLGLRLRDSGCVAVDAMGRTSRPGVYAAGDLAHTADFPMPVASVLAAAASGQLAAVALGADLLGLGR